MECQPSCWGWTQSRVSSSLTVWGCNGTCQSIRRTRQPERKQISLRIVAPTNNCCVTRCVCSRTVPHGSLQSCKRRFKEGVRTNFGGTLVFLFVCFLCVLCCIVVDMALCVVVCEKQNHHFTRRLSKKRERPSNTLNVWGEKKKKERKNRRHKTHLNVCVLVVLCVLCYYAYYCACVCFLFVFVWFLFFFSVKCQIWNPRGSGGSLFFYYVYGLCV